MGWGQHGLVSPAKYGKGGTSTGAALKLFMAVGTAWGKYQAHTQLIQHTQRTQSKGDGHN
jgi:hypothetical protein